MRTRYVPTLSCGNRPGIVAAVATALAGAGANIVESTKFRERVAPAPGAEDRVATGRDIESRGPARAAKHHLERRVVPNGHKTVVLA